MNELLRGAESMGFVVVAMNFLLFWRRSRDPLFLLFAVAFLLEGASRVALAINGDPLEGRPIFYLPRLLAYLLIIAGVVSKNVHRTWRPAGFREREERERRN